MAYHVVIFHLSILNAKRKLIGPKKNRSDYLECAFCVFSKTILNLTEDVCTINQLICHCEAISTDIIIFQLMFVLKCLFNVKIINLYAFFNRIENNPKF